MLCIQYNQFSLAAVGRHRKDIPSCLSGSNRQNCACAYVRCLLEKKEKAGRILNSGTEDCSFVGIDRR